MKCRFCQTENPGDANFCRNCRSNFSEKSSRKDVSSTNKGSSGVIFKVIMTIVVIGGALWYAFSVGFERGRYALFAVAVGLPTMWKSDF